MLIPRCNLGVKLPEVSLAWDGDRCYLFSIVGKYPPYKRLAFRASMGQLLNAPHSAGILRVPETDQPPSKEEHELESYGIGGSERTSRKSPGCILTSRVCMFTEHTPCPGTGPDTRSPGAKGLSTDLGHGAREIPLSVLAPPAGCVCFAKYQGHLC